LKQRATLFLLIVFAALGYKVGQCFHLPDQFSRRLGYRFNNNPVADPDHLKLDARTDISGFCGDSNSLRIPNF
jgi:hypothetical protein